MNLSKEALGLRYLIEGRDPLDMELDPVLSSSQRMRALVIEIGPEKLLNSLEIRNEAPWLPSLKSVVMAVLEQFSSQASVTGNNSMCRSCLEGMLRINPGNLGYIFRLLQPLDKDKDYFRILELMEPYLFVLVEQAESLAHYTPFVVTAAYESGRLDIVEYIRDGRAAQGMPAPEAEAASLRMAVLKRVGFGELPPIDHLSPLAVALRKAALALDELSVIEALKYAEADNCNGADAFTLRLALGVAGIMRGENWARPYRTAINVASGCLARSVAVQDTREQWSVSQLPEEGLEAFFVMAVRLAEMANLSSLSALRLQPEWERACKRENIISDAQIEPIFVKTISNFHTQPSFDSARQVWSSAYLSGRFAPLVRAAPTGDDAKVPVERARMLQIAPLSGDPGAPLWLLLTWHVEPDHLLRKLAVYAGDATLIVSLGSDGHPAGLARATSALFCDRVQFLVRPVVTWGGQRGWHHNLLEVMEIFRAQSGPSAWLQLVCDRTYPLKSLRRLSQLTAKGRLYRPSSTTPSWRKEWEREVTEALPRIYSAALDEAFSAGAPAQFVELSTQSPMHGTSDYRLQASTFNFSSEALPIGIGGRSSVHQYMVSPFEVDVKWMSFARLQELVDVATESRATYARRLHPVTMRWVHSVLMKYDLRIGDPWVYISHKFVDRVLNDPGFDELFSVMNLGFAPEMNYIDTCAASFSLFDDISHHFHVMPGEVVSDEMLPQVAVGADQHDKSFIRKTDPNESPGLMRFFSERILEERMDGGLHWAVVGGSFASDDKDPRPQIDETLLAHFVGGRVDVRDLIGSRVVQARFESGQIIALDDERLIATWQLKPGMLVVDHLDPPLGTKHYERAGGSATVLTLAPSELVSPRNSWSAFLDFHLGSCNAGLDAAVFGADVGMTILATPSVWIGAASAEAAILSAFSDPQRSDIPTPTVRVDGGIYEIRETGGILLALCSLDGFPAMLQISGFAQVGQRTAIHLKPAPTALAERWNDATPSALRTRLLRNDVPGTWILSVLEGSLDLVFEEGGWILDADGVRRGRWLLRTEGMQVLGLNGLLMGLADHLRLEDGKVKLAGWGWRNFKDAVTFTLHQKASSGKL